MTARRPAASSSQRIGALQARQQQDEFRIALRALLMQPLMAPTHADFPAMRRQADRLREWFLREAGWPLLIEREGARLLKRPADLTDATRGLPDHDRRRYVLLCLACAVLERADPQITLHLLGERILQLAAEPVLAGQRFAFTLADMGERRELVVVCRTLLERGILLRVAGDEEGWLHASGDGRGGPGGDVLYDIQRRLLSGLLAAVRGPSTWSPADAPTTFGARLQALVTEPVADSDDGRRTALRHHLARRLLDDPVVYTDSLDAELLGYFTNQRGPMALRLCDATGLSPEQRAEGLALTDEAGALTDVAMPAEGTDAHVTLLVAEYLATLVRDPAADAMVSQDAVAAFLRQATARYGRYWRKSAREPGAERELAQVALLSLQQLRLIERAAERIRPLPAIARFALGEAELPKKKPRATTASGSLF